MPMVGGAKQISIVLRNDAPRTPVRACVDTLHRSPGHQVEGGSRADIFVGRSATFRSTPSQNEANGDTPFPSSPGLSRSSQNPRREVNAEHQYRAAAHISPLWKTAFTGDVHPADLIISRSRDPARSRPSTPEPRL
jgi:hypothetical protein